MNSLPPFTGEQKNRLTFKEKSERLMNVFFSCLIPVISCISYLIFREVQKFGENLQALNPSYPFPKLSDFSTSIILLPFMIATKMISETLFLKVSDRIMTVKYKNSKDENNFLLGKIYRKKLATHIFKIWYYSSITVFGYLVLYTKEYFPRSFGGSGEMKNCLLPGFPNAFYHERSYYFNLYYYICFSYILSDWIWLLFISERTSEFINMLSHHVCTISLIWYSFWTNYSHIGILVLYVHNQSDIFVHLTRLFLQTDVYKIVKDATGLFLVCDILYMRIYGLGAIWYTLYIHVTWEWGVWTPMWLFLMCLYIMHINWSFLLLGKAYNLVSTSKFDDTCNVNAAMEKQKQQNRMEKK